MENDIKVPIIILTRDTNDGARLKDYLADRFREGTPVIEVCSTPEEMMNHLTHKHHNIVIVDYDKGLYQRAESLVYEKADKLAGSLVLSSVYDVQFILRKPSEHVMESTIDVKPGVTEIVVEDHKDYVSIGSLVAKLYDQRIDRKTYNSRTYMIAAVMLIFFIIMAVVIL